MDLGHSIWSINLAHTGTNFAEVLVSLRRAGGDSDRDLMGFHRKDYPAASYNSLSEVEGLKHTSE
jgi:hypothetical protein